jgi:hypothetical protein
MTGQGGEAIGERETLLPPCVTWNQFTQAVAENRIPFAYPLPELPNAYRKGCVLADQGFDTLVFYIFKDGFDIRQLPINTKLYQQLSAKHRIHRLLPPLKAFKTLPPSRYLRADYMRIGFDRPNRPNSFNLNNPSARGDWERPHLLNPYAGIVFYRTAFVDKLEPKDAATMVQLLEATRDRWATITPPTPTPPPVADPSSCLLKDWQRSKYEVTFTLTVTNRSDRPQTGIVAELEILDQDGNDVRDYNPFRRVQALHYPLEPPLKVGETRDLEGLRKYVTYWRKMTLKRCQWLNSPHDYREIYPEMRYAPPAGPP